MEVFGYLKGSAINANQLFHLTGYGDYSISRIDVLKNQFEENKNSLGDVNGVYLSQIPENPRKVELFADSSSNKIVEATKNFNPNENEGMMIEEPVEKKEEEVKNEMIEEEEEKIEQDDQSDVSYDENEANLKNMEEEKFH